MKNLRPRREYLKYLLRKHFGTAQDAAIVMGIRYTRLSQICSGAIQEPTHRELKQIKKHLRLTASSFEEVIEC